MQGLNDDSSCALDGFCRLCFQQCWEIICEDVTRIVKAFFCEHILPKFIIHINLVLLPKKEGVKTFSDLRPISRNFINKIISRLVHERLARVVPKMISLNQTEFVKSRSNTKNVLLAQEIIRDIRNKNEWHNVVVKLDITKSYDSLMDIFSKGFKEVWFF